MFDLISSMTDIQRGGGGGRGYMGGQEGGKV